jgi:hypothetical protein
MDTKIMEENKELMDWSIFFSDDRNNRDPEKEYNYLEKNKHLINWNHYIYFYDSKEPILLYYNHNCSRDFSLTIMLEQIYLFLQTNEGKKDVEKKDLDLINV